MIEVTQSTAFAKWMASLKDRKLRAIVLDRIVRLQGGNFGDAKPVGGGVSEARIHYAKGYRLYFQQRGPRLIIMLAGGSKSSQQKDIATAKALANQWRDA